VDSEHSCSNEKEDLYFSKLKLVYFFLVHYVTSDVTPRHSTDVTAQTQNNQNVTVPSQPASALHCVLRHAKLLEGIQATGLNSFYLG
jgi:hypothetical protein